MRVEYTYDSVAWSAYFRVEKMPILMELKPVKVYHVVCGSWTYFYTLGDGCWPAFSDEAWIEVVW